MRMGERGSGAEERWRGAGGKGLGLDMVLGRFGGGRKYGLWLVLWLKPGSGESTQHERRLPSLR